MPNIQFNYMYRDGANYKSRGEKIFTNPDNISIEEAEKTIKEKLIDEAWFYVDQWHLKDLHFTTWDNEIDHMWHEFEGLAYTEDTPTTTKTFKQFLDGLAMQR